MSTNIIKIYRGDTYEFNITVSDESSEGGKYILKGNDTLYFGLMEPNAGFEHSIVRKSVTADENTENNDITFDTAGNYYIKINPEDTEHLVPGVYYYSVKLEMDHAEESDPFKPIYKVITVINKTKFIILD